MSVPVNDKPLAGHDGDGERLVVNGNRHRELHAHGPKFLENDYRQGADHEWTVSAHEQGVQWHHGCGGKRLARVIAERGGGWHGDRYGRPALYRRYGEP